MLGTSVIRLYASAASRRQRPSAVRTTPTMPRKPTFAVIHRVTAYNTQPEIETSAQGDKTYTWPVGTRATVLEAYTAATRGTGIEKGEMRKLEMWAQRMGVELDERMRGVPLEVQSRDKMTEWIEREVWVEMTVESALGRTRPPASVTGGQDGARLDKEGVARWKEALDEVCEASYGEAAHDMEVKAY